MSTRRVVVLVTGGTGLLGRALRHVVKDDPAWVFVGTSDGDLRSELQTELLFARVRPTHVIHLASRVGGLFANRTDPAGFLVDNLRIDTNVLEACARWDVAKTITCLPMCVFPNDAAPPLTASALHSGPPHPAYEGTAHSRRLAEVLSRQLAAETGRAFVSIISANIYGPHDKFDPDTAGVIPSLIRQALKQPVLRVRGTGTARRQFLYSRDAARMVLWALHSYDDSSTPLVLAPPMPEGEVSIRTVATTIQLLTGCQSVEFDGDHKADGRAVQTARSSAAHLVGEFEFTGLRSGLEETIAWYLASV